MAYAIPADVAIRWLDGSVTDENRTYIAALLDDAETKLAIRVPGLLDRVASGSIAPAALVMVEVAMVLRVLRNPGIYTQQSAGPFTATVNSAVASGLLEATDGDLADLGISRGYRSYTFNTDPVWGD